MNKKNKKGGFVSLEGYINFVSKLSHDFYRSNITKNKIPDKYQVTTKKENKEILRSARKAAFISLTENPMVKVAFDTRRIDQDVQRNPRINLQYWNRSQEFLDQEIESKIKSLSNLIDPLEKIQKNYHHCPEYFHSFARSLLDSVKRVIGLKNQELDVFKPQIDYLEQLLYARYRLSLEDLEKRSEDYLYNNLLKKDEELTRRDAYLSVTGAKNEYRNQDSLVKTNQTEFKNEKSIIEAIFGSEDLRRNGEKSVERTVTITIRDEVKD